MVNVTIYSIHGSYGIPYPVFFATPQPSNRSPEVPHRHRRRQPRPGCDKKTCHRKTVNPSDDFLRYTMGIWADVVFAQPHIVIFWWILFFCLGDECLVFQTGMPTHYPMWGYVWPMNLQISEVSMQPWNIYGTQECIYTGYTVDIVSLWSVFQKVRMDYLHTSSKPTRQELRPVCFPCGKSNVLDILIPFLYQGRKTGSTIFRGGLGYAYDYIYSTYIYIYILY